MFRALVGLMDVPTMLMSLDQHMRQRGLSRVGALLIFACCMTIVGPLGYLYWRFDLASTWSWFEWLVSGGQETIGGAISDPNAAAMAVMMFGFGVTMFPSAVQLGLARFVTVPALGILLKITIAFDLGTDWPTMWQAVQAANWFDSTFTWAPVATVARVLACAAGTTLASVILQSMCIMILAVMFYCGFVLVFGELGGGRRAVLEA